jgi:hypothetical protein
MLYDKIVNVKYNTDTNEILIIFSHNYIEIWNTLTKYFIKRVFCEEECILYSGDYDV